MYEYSYIRGVGCVTFPSDRTSRNGRCGATLLRRELAPDEADDGAAPGDGQNRRGGVVGKNMVLEQPKFDPGTI